MKLKNFIAENVYGYLNFNIDFDERLTYLIGINGSGKTTAIRLILGLLGPSWFNLTQIKYDRAQLTCENEDKIIVLRSENQDDEKIKLVATINDEQKSGIFKRVKLNDDFNEDDSRFEFRQRLGRFSRYESHFSDLEVVKLIRELITPVYLGLDRSIYQGAEIDFLNFDNLSRRKEYEVQTKGNLFESLGQVEKMIKDAFLEYSQEHSRISNELKHEIIYSSFDIIDSKLDDGYKINIDIETRKQKILEASTNFEIPGLANKITEYFAELNIIQQRAKQAQDIKKGQEKEYLNLIGQYYVNIPHLQRIDKIIQLYENAQEEISKAYSLFLRFEELSNKFFIESGKTLRVQKTGLIEFTLPNKDISTTYNLSSGEKQILVMLATLIFGKQRDIFIIDEPELSLHLGWQEIFVDSIMQASPNTQFILATHSPTIVGEISNELYCRDLSYNTISNDQLS